MRSSLESDLQRDALAAFGHGIDDALTSFSTALGASQDCLTAELQLALRDRTSTEPRWVVMKISFTRIDVMHIEAQWSGIHSGAFVLYAGGRVLTGDAGELVVDLDPTTPSSFLIVGRGSVGVVEA